MSVGYEEQENDSKNDIFMELFMDVLSSKKPFFYFTKESYTALEQHGSE